MKRRLAYLDSIRGIAALIVMLYHIWTTQTLPFDGNFFTSFNSFPGFLHYSIDKLLPGRAAVMLFFVLSGFVLTYSLELKPVGYFPFIIKRIFRIYPAFLCVVLISYALHCWIGARVSLPNHVVSDDMLQVDTRVISLLRTIFMFGFIHDDKIDDVIWSLVHEMRASFLFPLILLTVRGGARSMPIYVAISIISTALSFYFTGKISNGNQEETMLASLLATTYFLIFFAAGAFLCTKKDIIADKVSRFSKTKIILLLMLSAALFMKASSSTSPAIICLSDYLFGAAAVILISVALGARHFQRILNHKIPVWLGRISYTLYLIHVPMIYLVTQTFGVNFTGYMVALSVAVLSLISAELLTRFIELPANKFGKKLAAVSQFQHF